MDVIRADSIATSRGGSAEWESTENALHLRGRRIRNTKPELQLRKALHALGLRYRLNRRIGRYQPDLVLPKYRVAVFVDGCFWHSCPAHGPKVFRGPNADRWRAKLHTNHIRDQVANKTLALAGWRVLRIWEHELHTEAKIALKTVASLAGCKKRMLA